MRVHTWVHDPLHDGYCPLRVDWGCGEGRVDWGCGGGGVHWGHGVDWVCGEGRVDWVCGGGGVHWGHGVDWGGGGGGVDWGCGGGGGGGGCRLVPRGSPVDPTHRTRLHRDIAPHREYYQQCYQQHHEHHRQSKGGNESKDDLSGCAQLVALSPLRCAH